MRYWLLRWRWSCRWLFWRRYWLLWRCSHWLVRWSQDPLIILAYLELRELLLDCIQLNCQLLLVHIKFIATFVSLVGTGGRQRLKLVHLSLLLRSLSCVISYKIEHIYVVWTMPFLLEDFFILEVFLLINFFLNIFFLFAWLFRLPKVDFFDGSCFAPAPTLP